MEMYRTYLDRVIVSRGRNCVYCGIYCTDDNIHLDNIIPISKGGKENDYPNMAISCCKCHQHKSELFPNGLLGKAKEKQQELIEELCYWSMVVSTLSREIPLGTTVK